MTTTLVGTITRVVFHNPDSFWTVIRLHVDDEPREVTAIGPAALLHKGEDVALTGVWQQDPKWGRQFKFDTCRHHTPGTASGIERYLASGAIKGVGEVMARRLVDTFGTEVIRIIERAPSRLLEVDGIGRKRLDEIVESFSEGRTQRETLIFLQSHGISPAFAAKIHKEYGDAAVDLITGNPYNLASHITGIGFKKADEIAASLGVDKESPSRLAAGLDHVLSRATSSGHLCLPEEELLRGAETLLEVPAGPLEDALASRIHQGILVREDVDGVPWIYLRTIRDMEQELAERFTTLGETPSSAFDGAMTGQIGHLIETVEESLGVALGKEQREAASGALEWKLLVVTGGPGTGKTTLIRAIATLFQRAGLKIAMCAPTGRAAKRLKEATGWEAKTIHRMLEFDPVGSYFRRDEDMPLDADAVIMDEASMVDLPLMYSLVSAIPVHARLVIVGDVDQLPPVGPGSTLRDLIKSGTCRVIRLGTVFRQSEGSDIIVNAHRINQGLEPELVADDPDREFYFIERYEPERILDIILELVGSRIPERFGLDPLEDIQVLTPMYRGLLGLDNLNPLLQEALNGGPSDKKGLREGDKVMQLRNNYDKEVFNGDIGFVDAIVKDGSVVITFDDKPILYDKDELDEVTLAYAISVHKSQGSEFPALVMPVHTQHYVMLKRNLLYTAVTRGKRLVVLVGTRKALSIAVGNDDAAIRYGHLARRLQALTPPPPTREEHR